MLRVMDFLMRRKWLVLILSILFVAGGILSYRMLYGQVQEQVAEYWRLSDDKWFSSSSSIVDIPHTGGESTENPEITPVILAVLNPNEVATIAHREENITDANLETSNPITDVTAPEAPENPEVPVEDASSEAFSEPASSPEAAEESAEAQSDDNSHLEEMSQNPPEDHQIAENISNSSIDSETLNPHTLVESTNLNNADYNATALATPVEPTPIPKHSIIYLIFLSFIGIGIVALGLYLVEQHFMR